MKVVQRRVPLRWRRGLIAAGQIQSEIKSRIQPEAVDRDVARQRGALRRADQAQIGIRDGTHTLRISEPDIVSGRGQRKIKLIIQGDESTESEIASTAARNQVLDL